MLISKIWLLPAATVSIVEDAKEPLCLARKTLSKCRQPGYSGINIQKWAPLATDIKSKLYGPFRAVSEQVVSEKRSENIKIPSFVHLMSEQLLRCNEMADIPGQIEKSIKTLVSKRVTARPKDVENRLTQS